MKVSMLTPGYGASRCTMFKCLHWCDNVINDVKLYIPMDTGLKIAEKYKEISNNKSTWCKFNALL